MSTPDALRLARESAAVHEAKRNLCKPDCQTSFDREFSLRTGYSLDSTYLWLMGIIVGGINLSVLIIATALVVLHYIDKVQ